MHGRRAYKYVSTYLQKVGSRKSGIAKNRPHSCNSKESDAQGILSAFECHVASAGAWESTVLALQQISVYTRCVLDKYGLLLF